MITLSNIAGSTLDLNHAVYSTTNQASPCGALTQIVCSNPNLSVATGLTIGNVYLIRIYTAGNAFLQTTTFTLCVSVLPPPPVNDNCANAIVITTNNSTICTNSTNATLTSATASTQPIGCGNAAAANDDVWFQFTAASSIQLISLTNIVGTSTNLYHALYSGTCGALTQVYCSDPENSTANNLVIGQVYYIRVYSVSTAANEIINFTVCVGRPVQCSDAEPFCGQDGLTYPNSTNTPNQGNIGCLGTTPNASWFYLQVQNSGTLSFQIQQTSSTTGAGIDVDFIMWGPFTAAQYAANTVCNNLNDYPDGTVVTPNNQVACSYSAAAIENFTVTNAVAGNFYIVMITNFSNQPGTVTFNQTNAPPPGQTPGPGVGTTNCDLVCSITLPADQFLCNQSSYTITSTNQNADSYAWFNGTTLIPGQTTASLVVTQSGTYKCVIQCGLNSKQDTINIVFNNIDAQELNDVIVCNSYVLPTLNTNNNYFTGTNGSGTQLTAGSTVTSTQTIYVYSQAGTTPNCTDESSFVVTVNTTPVADNPADVVQCSSYTLPTLTVGNYFTGANGTGLPLSAGNVITTSQTIYVFAQTNSTPNCTSENSFTVTINNVDAQELNDVTVCDNYTLPTLNPNNNYYTGSNGTGTQLNAGAVITTSQTIYVYAQSGTTPNCTDESSFVVTVNTTPIVDNPADVVACTSYTLPTLANGNYYTGTNGSGTLLNAGTVITTSQTLYVFKQTSTTPNCSSENSFNITINTIDAQELNDVTACNSFTLGSLNANNNYFTGPNGTGTSLAVGTVITTSQTIYVYAQSGTTPNCTDQSLFIVTINNVPILVPVNDVDVCDSFTLPNTLPSNTNYYTAANGSGTIISSGTVLTSSQTVYIFAQSGTTPNCTSEDSFNVTITKTPEFEITGGCDGSLFVLTTVPLNNSYDPATVSYSWKDSNNSEVGTQSTYTATTSGMYTCTITAIPSSCNSVENFDASQTACVIQKGISPNGDGFNDSLDLTGFNVKKLAIFNRYGQEAYSKNNYTNQWFGQTNKGDELPDGTYYYLIERENAPTKTGWVYINRVKN